MSDGVEGPPLRVPDMERIRNARRKRQQQMKRWNQYDKTMDKKQKKQVQQQQQGQQSSLPTSPTPSSGARRYPGMPRVIQFAQSVILLEAAARDDLDEGRHFIISFNSKLHRWTKLAYFICTIPNL